MWKIQELLLFSKAVNQIRNYLVAFDATASMKEDGMPKIDSPHFPPFLLWNEIQSVWELAFNIYIVSCIYGLNFNMSFMSRAQVLFFYCWIPKSKNGA